MDDSNPHRVARPSRFSNWDADAALVDLAEESRLLDGDDIASTARRVLDEGTPACAAQLVHLALYGTTEKIRLDASSRVLDRSLGPANMAYQARHHQDDPLLSMLKLFTDEAETNPNLQGPNHI